MRCERDGLGAFGLHDARRGQRGRAGKRGLQDIATFHEMAAPNEFGVMVVQIGLTGKEGERSSR